MGLHPVPSTLLSLHLINCTSAAGGDGRPAPVLRSGRIGVAWPPTSARRLGEAHLPSRHHCMDVCRHTSWQRYPCQPVVMAKGACFAPQLPLELKGAPGLALTMAGLL